MFDVIGNVWQHTCTPIYPFSGFDFHPLYNDFTTPTFDQRHDIIKGGSFISTGNEAMQRSRYAFRRHFFQFAGFRMVKAKPAQQSYNWVDQSDSAVREALVRSFIEEDTYYKQLMAIIKPHLTQVRRSLVLGCSVGRLPFELSQTSEESYGVDYTARYFQMATRLWDKGSIKYQDIEIDMEQLGFVRDRIQLYQMDPSNLSRDKLGVFDLTIVDSLCLRKGATIAFLRNCLWTSNNLLLIVSDSFSSARECASVLYSQNWVLRIQQLSPKPRVVYQLFQKLEPYLQQSGLPPNTKISEL